MNQPAASPLRAAFEAVEIRRSQAGISRAELCRRADLNESTYTLLLQRRDRVPHVRTVRSLERALMALHPVAPARLEAAE